MTLLVPILFWMSGGRIPRFWVHSIDISGTVTDEATGKPVASARVVVQVHSAFFLRYETYRYGLVADQQGRFYVETDPPIRVDWVEIYVSSPDDRYGELKYSQEPANIEVSELPASLRKYDWTHYDSFTGRDPLMHRTEDMGFPRERWEVRTPQEIDVGIPAAK